MIEWMTSRRPWGRGVAQGTGGGTVAPPQAIELAINICRWLFFRFYLYIDFLFLLLLLLFHFISLFFSFSHIEIWFSFDAGIWVTQHFHLPLEDSWLFLHAADALPEASALPAPQFSSPIGLFLCNGRAEQLAPRHWNRVVRSLNLHFMTTF